MKNKKMSIRISDADLKVVHHKAAQAKMSLTDYVTASCKKQKINIITDLSDTIKELKAQGRNLNQLTVLANTGRIKEVNLTFLLEEYAEIQSSLQEILERKRWSCGNS